MPRRTGGKKGRSGRRQRQEAMPKRAVSKGRRREREAEGARKVHLTRPRPYRAARGAGRGAPARRCGRPGGTGSRRSAATLFKHARGLRASCARMDLAVRQPYAPAPLSGGTQSPPQAQNTLPLLAAAACTPPPPSGSARHRHPPFSSGLTHFPAIVILGIYLDTMPAFFLPPAAVRRQSSRLFFLARGCSATSCRPAGRPHLRILGMAARIVIRHLRKSQRGD